MAKSNTHILQNLNPEQKLAVISSKQYLRIVAGAGTGKTSVLTSKIAYAINDAKDAYPQQILALTFTNKAAAEMRARLAKLVGEKADSVWIYTFHSLCNIILKYEAKNLAEIDEIPLKDSSFNIIDDGDQRKILSKIYDDLDIGADKYSYAHALDFISKNKNKELTIEEVYQHSKTIETKIYAQIYDKYINETASLGVIDFDDLQIFVKLLFEKRADIATKWQKKFRLIFVDEFQDTSYIQYEIMKFFTKETNKLVVVGDPDQTIYSWRGAEPSLILNINQDFPDLETIILNRNYRSNQQILDAANKLIANNKNRIDKKLESNNHDKMEIKFFHGDSPMAEAEWICAQIQKIASEQKGKYSNIAILYRNHSYVRTIEDTFLKRGVPYSIFGNASLIDNKFIKDAIYFLKVINSFDNFAFQQILNVPSKKIGPTTLEKLNNLANEHGYSLINFFLNYYTKKLKLKPDKKIPLRIEVQQKISHLLSHILWANKKKSEIESYMNLQINDTNSLIDVEEAKNQPKVKQFSWILKTFLKEIRFFESLKDSKESSDIEKKFVDFYAQMNEWQKNNPTKTLRDFIDDIALDGVSDKTERNQVLLMTVHASKGLEFDSVFLVGMTQGIFPSIKVLKTDDKDIYEEERRLAFVAITRAKTKLFISNADTKRWDREKNSYNLGEVSDFVGEMQLHSEQVYQFTKLDMHGKLNYHKTNAEDYQEGDKVRHATFGDGVVIVVEQDSLQIKFAKDTKEYRTIIKTHKFLSKVN